MIDLSTLDDARLRTFISNHEDAGATERPAYAAAVDEWNRRKGGCLEFKLTLALVRAAAAERRFLSYGEIADAHGADWDHVRYPMNSHLWALVRHAHARRWPLLSAIIVNRKHVATGHMEPATLKGFVEAATQLGYAVDDPQSFLKEQQRLCFEWGERQVDTNKQAADDV